MNRFLFAVPVFAALGTISFQVHGQNPPAAQTPKANADPYANNADPGKLSFPLAASSRQGQRRDEGGAARGHQPGAVRYGKLEIRTAV